MLMCVRYCWKYVPKCFLAIRTSKLSRLTPIRCFSSQNNEAINLTHPLIKKKMASILSDFSRIETEAQKAKLLPLYLTVKSIERIQSDLESLQNIIEEHKDDKDILEMAKRDSAQLYEELNELEDELLGLLVPPSQDDDRGVMLELTAGVGGQEAMLFAADLFNMYCRYCSYRGWDANVLECDTTDIGGVRNASVNIDGEGVYRSIKYEGGVHRVQRVPQTEKGGRIHTSTVAVAVLQKPTKIELDIRPSDLKFDTMRASGAGGQHVNTTDSAVRVTHIPTGIRMECQSTRSQHKNKEIAVDGIRTKLYQQQIKNRRQSMQTSRRLQVGSSSRSEKIRTYNYPQDRITDHRVNLSTSSLPQIMEGQEKLHRFLEQLQSIDEKDRLLEILD